ncbi:MAG: TadE/TadG family type IV pilus assembly protein [Pseudomonadota bacterium]
MDTSARALLHRAKALAQDTQGNIAMMSGVIALPFMTMLALAVDVGYASNHQHSVQSSLDSALLAAAREGIEGGATKQEMEAELAVYFQSLVAANGSGVVCAAPVIDPALLNGDVRADVDCYSETIMAGVIGREKIEYSLSSEVNFGIGKIDVAFVFDVSGSMDNEVSNNGQTTTCHNGTTNCTTTEVPSRMEALQDAAKAGVDQLLKVNSTDTDDVRISMVSYNQAVNAGVYFQAATGLEPIRTYYYGDGDGAAVTGEAVIDQVGQYHNKLLVKLYDTRDNSVVAEIRDGTVVTIPSDMEDYLNMSAEIRSTHHQYGWDESMELRVSTTDGVLHTKVENYLPYAVFGDNNGDFHSGDLPTGEWAALRVRTYTANNLGGNRISNKTFDFRIDVDEVPSVTISDSCTYERNNASTWNTTDAPSPGNYLTADEATYDEDSQTWTIPKGCSSAKPLPLTADQSVLDDYINALPTGGGTAGHLGMAWGRYLLAPEWKNVWPVTSEPLDYNEPDARKIIIMMTDGQFNRTYHSNLGNSFNQAKNHCDRAKEQGIIIYTISFDAPSDAQAALDYCSSGTEYAFDVNNGQELLDAYTAIANRIADLRITS